MSAYQDAVTAINAIATDPRPETVRQELEALRALIDLLADKLPSQESDYETDMPARCIHCDPTFKPTGPDDWCQCQCHAKEHTP